MSVEACQSELVTKFPNDSADSEYRRISTTPSYTRPTRSPSRSAPKKTYRGPTRLISPPEARAVARYERAPSPPQYHHTRQSGPSYSSSAYAAPRAPDLAKPVRAYERSPARHAPAAESRSVIADAYANRSSTVSERAPSGYAGEPRTARDKPTFADPSVCLAAYPKMLRLIESPVSRSLRLLMITAALLRTTVTRIPNQSL
jgi:hypothetical protein